MFEETFKDRKKSLLIKTLTKNDDISVSDASRILNTSINYYNNKLVRNSWSFDDIVAIAYLSGYDMIFVKREDSSKTITIDARDYNPAAVKRIEEIKKELLDKRYAEYQKLKSKIKSMKDYYGFED